MKWYQIRAQVDSGSADIYIIDFIGDWIDGFWGLGVTAKQFLQEIQNLPESVKTIRVHVNSPGGDVVSASHIANMLREQRIEKGRHVEVLIEGAAWSAATIITSAGDPTRIADNALMFVHNPWAIVLGDASDLRKEAEGLDKFRNSIVATYRWKSSLSEDELIELMDADTWMGADEAIENGFADEKIEGLKAAAAFDRTVLAKMRPKSEAPPVPEEYRERLEALLKPALHAAPVSELHVEPSAEELRLAGMEEGRRSAAETARNHAAEIYQLCIAAGVPDLVTEFLENDMAVENVRARLTDARMIRSICVAAGMPEVADGWIKAGLPLEPCRRKLFEMRLALEGPEINNKCFDLNKAEGMGGVIDVAEIYARRKRVKNGIGK